MKDIKPEHETKLKTKRDSNGQNLINSLNIFSSTAIQEL